MRIGCLGKIIFTISKKKIQTLTSLSYSGSSNFTDHAVHGKAPVPEFTGRNLKEITIDITFSKYLGANPMKSLGQIRKYAENGSAISFTTGSTTWGYKWVITSWSVKAEYFDRKGNIDQMVVSVTLKEYPRTGKKKK